MTVTQPVKKELESMTVKPEEDSIIYQWSCHPVKRNPLLSAGVTLLVILIVALVYNTTLSIWFALLALVVMYLSLAKFYFPTHYRLSDKGITVKTTTQTFKKAWKEFRSAYPDKNGILLSPFVEPSRLENFRGIYLMFNNNRDQVVTIVNSHIIRAPDNSGDGEKA
jgi:hypothetical protein